jgi:hypothetical protein
MRRELETIRNKTELGKRVEEENNALRSEITTCWQQLQRVEPNNPHVYGPFTSVLAGPPAGNQQPPNLDQGRLPPLQSSTMPPPPGPFSSVLPGPMDGVQSDRYHQF